MQASLPAVSLNLKVLIHVPLLHGIELFFPPKGRDRRSGDTRRLSRDLQAATDSFVRSHPNRIESRNAAVAARRNISCLQDTPHEQVGLPLRQSPLSKSAGIRAESPADRWHAAK